MWLESVGSTYITSLIIDQASESAVTIQTNLNAGSCHGPFNSTPMGVTSMSPAHLRTYDPWGVMRRTWR